MLLSKQAIGDLSISGLSQLTDLSGLENLAQYGDELSIVNNQRLTTTAQLSANITPEPSNFISLNNIGVRSNPLLRDLDGFRLVENVTGNAPHTCRTHVYVATCSVLIYTRRSALHPKW